jgi:hypothetical protein
MSSPRLTLAILVATTIAATHAQTRPQLAFREDWRETSAATPITQDHVANPDSSLVPGTSRKGAVPGNNACLKSVSEEFE